MKLQKNIYSNDNNLESVCITNLKQAEEKVVRQQETVLKYQTELHLCTQGLQDIKKKIKNEFDSFCGEKFKITLPNVDTSIHSVGGHKKKICKTLLISISFRNVSKK